MRTATPHTCTFIYLGFCTLLLVLQVLLQFHLPLFSHLTHLPSGFRDNLKCSPKDIDVRSSSAHNLLLRHLFGYATCLSAVSIRTGCVTLSKEWQPPWLETSTAEPIVEFSVGKGPQRLEFLSAGGFYDVMTNPSCTLNYILFKPLSLFKMS